MEDKLIVAFWAARILPLVEIFLGGDNFATRADQLLSCSAVEQDGGQTYRYMI